MELKEAKRVLNDWNKAEEWTIKDPDYRHKDVYIERKEAIETVLQALEQLQKENEGIKARIDKYIQGGNETLRLEHEETLKYYHENYISKDKIKELILNKQKQIQENTKEIEENRKTIMKEQELKKLRIYTLHKNNNLLELEIADLFELLKGE